MAYIPSLCVYFSIESRGIIALFCLCFSIRDARVKIDHNRVISLVNVSELYQCNLSVHVTCMYVQYY